MTEAACPACGGAAIAPFYTVENVPASSCLLLADEAAARGYPRGDLRLAVCGACGFIANTAFDPALTTYSAEYEETQGFSPQFRDYLIELAQSWVARYDLAGKTVVEIGCGKGEFLCELLRAGVGQGVGIDPSLNLDRLDSEIRDRATWVTGLFPEDYPRLDADAVVCRHTLEHLGHVGSWLRSVRAAIGANTDAVVLFEVPDVRRVLEEGAFWDVYYEHCSYFSAGSLKTLFRRSGFEPLDLVATYGGQYLTIAARLAPAPASPVVTTARDLTAILAAAERFAALQREMTAYWRRRVQEVAAQGGRTVLWGASSKAVGFLAALSAAATDVTAAVDINPHKHDHYLAGTGHRIIPPKELRAIKPTLVIAMNPIYVDEIRRDLEALGIAPGLEAVA